eukprot:6505490-Prymnesium_polylepis.1
MLMHREPHVTHLLHKGGAGCLCAIKSEASLTAQHFSIPQALNEAGMLSTEVRDTQHAMGHPH